MKKLLTIYWGFLVVLILSFFAIQPFFSPGFFPIHDDTQIVRVSEMGQALRDGHFPVRWVKDLGYGYGYPLFNFYAPLPYYVGGFTSIVGFDPLVSTKLIMILGILLSGVFMYLLAREFWGELGGVVSGLFYVYAPYHAVDVYVRGAVGEFWAMAFIPLAFYGLWKICKEQKWWWVMVGSLGYAGTILSHNLTAMIVAPFLLIATLLYCYIAHQKQKFLTIRYTLHAIFLGLGLSAFYWIPALFEMQYTNVISQIGGGADFRNHFVCWQQLWESTWGFGGSVPGCIDGMSFKIGKLHVIVSFVALITGLYLWERDRTRAVITLSAIFSLLFSIFMMLEPSRFVWEAVYPLTFIQYPWRFLVLILFFSSFLAGGSVWFLSYFNTRSYYSKAGAIGLIFLLLFFNIKLFQPQTVLSKTVDDYISETNIKWITSKTSDEYMPKDFEKPMLAEEVAKTRVSAREIIRDKTQELVFYIDNKYDENLHINVASFPAWKVFVDGSVSNYVVKDNGLEVTIPKGKHEVRASFVSTPIELLANSISIISILGCLMIYLKSFKSH